MEGWAYSDDRNDVRGKAASWLLRQEQVRASLREGIANPSERASSSAQAGCQVTAAELGPSSGCPDRMQFGLWPEGGTMVTSITHPRSLGAWGSCSIPFLSSTGPPLPPRSAPESPHLGQRFCPRHRGAGREWDPSFIPLSPSHPVAGWW